MLVAVRGVWASAWSADVLVGWPWRQVLVAAVNVKQNAGPGAVTTVTVR